MTVYIRISAVQGVQLEILRASRQTAPTQVDVRCYCECEFSRCSCNLDSACFAEGDCQFRPYSYSVFPEPHKVRWSECVVMATRTGAMTLFAAGMLINFCSRLTAAAYLRLKRLRSNPCQVLHLKKMSSSLLKGHKTISIRNCDAA